MRCVVSLLWVITILFLHTVDIFFHRQILYDAQIFPPGAIIGYMCNAYIYNYLNIANFPLVGRIQHVSRPYSRCDWVDFCRTIVCRVRWISSLYWQISRNASTHLGDLLRKLLENNAAVYTAYTCKSLNAVLIFSLSGCICLIIYT